MAFNAAAWIVASNAITAAYPYISLHTSGAVTSSANESTAPRIAANWAVNGTTGVMTITNRQFTGGTSGGSVVRVGYWSASTGGSYGGGFLLVGDQAFNAAGSYSVDQVTETPQAT